MIVLIPVGEIDGAVLECLRESIVETFHEESTIGTAIPLPPESWNRKREQYDAEIVLGSLPSPMSGTRMLAVAGVDLFSRGLNFVFGLAEEASGRAIVSLWRLRQELYYRPRDDALLRRRAVTEAIHELGHTYGLIHCPSASCVMFFSNSLPETDSKGSKLCRACRGKLAEKG